MKYLASDVGGTFTDLVLVDTAANTIEIDKVSSTGASAEGILGGMERLAKSHGVPLGDIAVFVHGFTIATNAWLTRSGARVAMVVTQGFRDLLEIGTQQRSNLYALVQKKAAPLVPRSRIFEVRERIDAFGGIVEALDDGEIARVVDLLESSRPTAVAVSLIFGQLNPVHERRLAEAIRGRLPGIPIYLSSSVNAEIGEYARTNTVATAAYVGPAVASYLSELEDGLERHHYTSPLLLMRSDGGVATAAAARDNPATMLLSGPAGGVIAASALGEAIGARNIITFDMGGTSADFSLIDDGRVRLATERVIDEQVLRVDMLDIETISAGGGSIATVDRAGALHVGPQSAGSRPGPVCYGQGGTEPTLTDAVLALGILDPADFAGGQIRLDAAGATRAIAERIAAPLGLSVERAALGMVSVASAHMRQAIRALSVERGFDIRRFSLLAFGGAGAIFGALMERELGVAEVLVPPRPGVFAAYGLLLADIMRRAQAPYTGALAAIVPDDLRGRLLDMKRELGRLLVEDGIAADRQTFLFSANMRYVGQFHDIVVPLPDPTDAGWWRVAEIERRFRDRHERAFGHADPSGAVEIVALRAEARGKMDKPRFVELARRTSGAPAPRRHREMLFDADADKVACPVYAREDLLAGDVIEGPAVIGQSDTTVLLTPGQTGAVDAYGVIHICTKKGTS